MSWKSIVGGVAGFVVGGPLGAAAGAAIGAGLDVMDDDGQGSVPNLPRLDAELNYVNDEDGTLLIITMPTVPNHAHVFVHARSGDRYLKTNVEGYHDEDGDFAMVLNVENGRTSVYLPQGIVEPDSEGEITLSFRALVSREDESPLILGETRFHLPHPSGEYREVSLWRPLIYLCMRVAYADGSLDKTEVIEIKKLLIKNLEIPRSESDMIKKIMRSFRERTLEESVEMFLRRFPRVNTDGVLECLASVAKADGVIDPGEVGLIQQVYAALGYNSAGWDDAAAALGLHESKNNQLEEFRQLLGVKEHATKSDVKHAFRRKAAEYHPDKYQDLPDEFKQVAHTMMQRLNEAREALLNTEG